MPKIGMEPLRRRELIDAAIRTIGQRGSLDVTVAQIAHEAGVSPALAHHYFGGKDKLILATMRHLLRELGQDLNAAIGRTETPRERIAAIIAVNFSASQFAQETIAAWLTFYVHAQQSEDTRRLLRIYARRLHSNLVFALEQLTSRERADANVAGERSAIARISRDLRYWSVTSPRAVSFSPTVGSLILVPWSTMSEPFA